MGLVHLAEVDAPEMLILFDWLTLENEAIWQLDPSKDAIGVDDFCTILSKLLSEDDIVGDIPISFFFLLCMTEVLKLQLIGEPLPDEPSVLLARWALLALVIQKYNIVCLCVVYCQTITGFILFLWNIWILTKLSEFLTGKWCV